MLHVAFVRSPHAHARMRADRRGRGARARPAWPACSRPPTRTSRSIASRRARPAGLRRDRAADPGLAGRALRGRGGGRGGRPTATRPRTRPRLVSRGLRAAPGRVDLAGPRPERRAVHEAAPGNVLLARRFAEWPCGGGAGVGGRPVVERDFRTQPATAAPLEGAAPASPTGARARASSPCGRRRRCRTCVRHAARRHARPARESHPRRRARRGRRLRREGGALSRGRRAVRAGHAAGPAGEVDRAAARGRAGLGPRARPSLCGAGRLRSGRPAARPRRHGRVQRRRVLGHSVDRRDRGADGGRTARRPLQGSSTIAAR